MSEDEPYLVRKGRRWRPWEQSHAQRERRWTEALRDLDALDDQDGA